MNSMNGYKYFVTFIDCFSYITWIYLMKNMSEVFDYFKDFHKSIQTLYGTVVKVLRSNNGTKYTNRISRKYLSIQ
jgi:hypothetical protein